MSERDNKGIIYYKLEDRYDNDTTKYCGLTPGEVDSNFNFLRGKDIESISWDSYNHNLSLKRFNGEVLKVDEVISEIEIEDKGIFSNDSLTGNGLVNNPLKLSDTLKTGFYAPVESFIDLTKKENSLPLNPSYGTRILTKENINPYGLLYNYKGVERIKEILERESSLWRIPTDEEWGEMLNAIELSDDTRNHLTDISNTFYGSIAGATLKKGCYKWSLIKISNESIETSLKVEKLQDPTYIEYYNTLDENIFYEVEVNENGSKKYYQYKCVNIWVESDETTQQKDILTSYNFNVLPCGFADSLNYSNVKSFGKWAGFWSSTPIPSSDIWVRQFSYNSDKVLKQSESRNAFFSVRLVRDYNDSVSPIEIINDIPYNTVLMPYLRIDPNSGSVIEGNKVWTTTNVSFLSVLNDKHQINAIEVKDSEGKELPSTEYFFLNYWNGEYWEKRQLKNNSMLIIGNGPDGSLNEEWQFINGELYKRSQEIIDALEEYTDEKISVLEEKHDSNIKDLQDTHNEDVNKITSLIEDYEATTAESLTDLTNKIVNEIERATSKENELFINISNVESKLNEEIAERINIDNTHNTQIEKLYQDIEDVESKLDEEIAKRGDDVLDLTNKINEETKNRENSDNVLSEEITKNKIVSIETPNNSIESTIKESDNGTTISIDILLDDSSCEFLRHSNAGITDVGIKTFVGEVEDNLIDTYDKKIGEISTKLHTEIENRYNSIENVNNEIDELKSQNTEEHGNFDKRLVLIENDYLKNSDKDELSREILNIDTTINNRIDNINNDITSNDGNFVEVRLTQVNGKINKITIKENDIAKSSDLSELKERIDTFFKSANLSGDTIDTLREIQDYITSDASAAAEMTASIKTAKDAADAAQGEVDALENVVATKAAQSDLNELAGRVTTAEGEIDTLQESLAAGGATAEAIKAAKDAADAAQGEVDALENVVDNVINSINNEIINRKDEDNRIREEHNSSLISTKSEIESAYILADKTLKEELEGKITSTNTIVTTIESDYLTSLDKSELISSNKVTSDRISEVEKNYLLADAELNKRLEVIEGGYALKSDVNTEIERAKSEETRIETLVESKLESSTFNEKVVEIDNRITNLTKKDESIDTEILDIKNNYVLKSVFDSEVIRAEGAEATLLAKIEGETERALTKETAIEKLISNETVRAEEKEGELSDSIVNLKLLIGDDKVSTQISNALGLLDFSDIAQNEMFVSEIQQENGKIKVGRLPFSGVTYIKDIRNEVDILKNDVTEKAPISSVYTKDETYSTFVNKSQIVNALGGSETLIVSQKTINEEIDKLRSEIINSGSGGEVDLTTVFERLQKIETDIANINEKIGGGTIITTDNITEYIVTPLDNENIVISKTENGGISIKLVKIDNMNF